MNQQELIAQIHEKQSYLCVGLDTALDRLPAHLPKNASGFLAFNRQIIEATAPFAVAYKINTAFYEALGAEGWQILEETLAMLPANTFKIADAKRGDIGNTSRMYAQAFFEKMDFDALTVAPYMGEDSVLPFLAFKGKWVILLALTSNVGSRNFQHLFIQNAEEKLFESVLRQSQQWGTPENLMYVVGATQAEALKQIREIIPHHFLLVPGVGAQGGSLQAVSEAGLNAEVGLLVNSSRGVIYASNGEDFAEAAAQEAQKLQEEMASYLQQTLQ